MKVISMKSLPSRCITFFLMTILICFTVPGVLSAAEEAAVQKKPDLPDLDVTYISRTPRYPGYVLKYQSTVDSHGEFMPFVGDPETGEAITEKQAAKIKRWPDEGDEVTFTGMVCNHGTKPSGSFDYIWYIDGKQVEKGTHESLDGPSLVTDEFDVMKIGDSDFKLAKRVEGTYCKLELKWKWRKGRHYVRLDIDPSDKIDEICEVNNDVCDATDACSFIMMTDAYTYNTLSEVENHWKSYNFDDILKYHREQMHRKFRMSVHPLTPNGILEEVRWDVILVQAEGEKRDRIGGGLQKLSGGWDSHWDFTGYVNRDQPERKYSYAKSQDWGLPHELGHQLGLIDIYCFDTEGGDGGNRVVDDNGDPVLLSHFSGQVGMMRGHGDVHFSEHSAFALNQQLGRRRGYFGDYIWSLPDKIKVRIVDFEGEPVPGARLKFYQHKGRYVDDELIFEGQTDKNGVYELANRESMRFRTDNGFEIKPNPFGQINIVGTNGIFFIEVQARGTTDYVWLEIANVNLAFWKGQKEEASFDLKTIVPGRGATVAPDVQQVLLEGGNGIELRWKPIIEGETYTVYQRVNFPPRWEVVKDGEGLTEPVYKPQYRGNGRYMVIAAHNGKVSAPSKEQRVVGLANPMGITLDADGRRIIRDSGHSMPIMFRPDNTTIGIFGTFHMGLGGVGDITRTKEGNLLATSSSRAPIRIFDDKAFFFGGAPYNKRTAGTFGDGDMQFKNPVGITIDSKERVWICDTGNGRVQILDKPLSKVLFKIGSEAGLVAPTKVAELPGDRYFAVSDPEAGKVIVLELKGDSWKTVNSIDIERPVYLAVGDGRLFVSDERTDPKADGRVLSFRISGSKLIPESSHTNLKGKPYGLAYDKERKTLVVVNRTNKRLENISLK